MADLCPLVALLAFAYWAAFAGQAGALLTRLCLLRQRGSDGGAEAAAWCVFLPPLAVLLLPVVSLMRPDGTVSGAAAQADAAHRFWHAWADALPRSSFGHGALHGANVLFLLLSALCLARAVYVLARPCGLASVLRALRPRRLPDNDAGAFPLFCLPSAKALCFTVGLLRPRVYVSSGLLEGLSAGDRAAMLAHEAAHVRRRDNLVNLLLALFYTLLPLPGGWLLRDDWERAVERACDREAARRIGDPCAVAQALVGAARLLRGGAPVPGAAHFAASGEDDIAGRVHALLALESGEGPASCSRRAHLVFALFTAAHLSLLAATHGFLRHVVEFFAYH